jgi:hypothetical protein
MLRFLLLILGAGCTGVFAFALLASHPFQLPGVFIAVSIGALLGWFGGFVLQLALRLFFLAVTGGVIGALLGFATGLLISGDAFFAARVGASLGALLLLLGRSGRTIRNARAAAAGSAAPQTSTS